MSVSQKMLVLNIVLVLSVLAIIWILPVTPLIQGSIILIIILSYVNLRSNLKKQKDGTS